MTVGIRELRQDASNLIRRAEAGEDITITVSGRPSVRLVPVDKTPNYWHTWEEVRDVFQPATPAEVDAWNADLAYFDDELTDPWLDVRQDRDGRRNEK